MDPLSIATGAISVAGAGVKLVQSLRSYVETVNKADKWIEALADRVKLTSAVLDNVGVLLRTEEVRKHCTTELLTSTNTALNGCKGVFSQLEAHVAGFIRQNKSGHVGLTANSTSSLSQNELNVLQARLDRFRSSLDLILAVLDLPSSTK